MTSWGWMGFASQRRTFWAPGSRAAHLSLWLRTLLVRVITIHLVPKWTAPIPGSLICRQTASEALVLSQPGPVGLTGAGIQTL